MVFSAPHELRRAGTAPVQSVKYCAPARLSKFALDGTPKSHVPGGTGASTWLSRLPDSATIALTPMQPDGLPIAASGIASSIPVVTPAPEAAAQPLPTPAVLRLSIVASMPYGF